MFTQSPFKCTLRTQLAQALFYRSSLKEKGLDAGDVDGVITSITETLGEIERAKADGRNRSHEGFVMMANFCGDPEVRLDGRIVPGTGSTLPRLLEEPGITLLKGQVVRMSDTLVKGVLEEALSKVGVEINRYLNTRKSLQAAWFRFVDGSSAGRSSQHRQNGPSMAA